MTPSDLLQHTTAHNPPGAAQILIQLCERLPASTLADMIAHTIATDEEGESEPTSDFLYNVGKHRFGDDWQTHIESAKARYDTGFTPTDDPTNLK
jgi:hypothetical protein